jgi:hypothetical protein
MSKIVTLVFEIDTEVPPLMIKESLEKIITNSSFNVAEFALKIKKLVVEEREDVDTGGGI